MDAHERRVRRFSSLIVAFAVLATGMLPPGRANAEPGVATPARVVVLLCKFSDQTSEPRSVAEYTRLFNASGAGTGGFDDYWREQSYGTLDLGATSVRGWYTLPVTQATYNSWGFDRSRKARSCIDAATDVDFRQHRSIVVVTNTPGDYTGFMQELTFGGQTRSYGVTVLWGGLDVSASVQELAHGSALGHSWSTRNPGVPDPRSEREYGNPYDVMSAALVHEYTSPVYGFSAGPGFNGPNREWFGWLPSSRVATYSTDFCAASCSRTYLLADLNTPSAPGALLLKIPTEHPGWYFTVEYRRPLGWDQGIPANSVLLHEVRPNGINYLTLTSPRGTGEWRPGETFTATAPTPFTVSIGVETGTGSIYVTVTRSLAPERWVPIGGAAATLVSGGMKIFITQPGTNNLLRYDGVPHSWSTVGGPGAKFVGNKRWLFALDPSGSRVYRYDGEWHPIGDAADLLIAGGESLYAIQPRTGNIWQYDGVPYLWTQVGGPGAQFVVNDAGLFAINTSGTAVLRYTGTPGAWEQIGGGATRLIVTDTALFAVQPVTGNLWRYDGMPFSWTPVGGPGAQFVGNGNTLYALATDRQAVLRFTGTPGVWEQVGGPASQLASTGTHLYAVNPSGDALLMLTR